MELNLLLIIVLIIVLWRLYAGLKNGLVEEINKLISLIAALFVLALAVMVIYGFMEENTKNIIAAVIALIMTGLVFRLISVMMKSLETLAKLPIISILNKILGAAAGFAEVIIFFWIVYALLYFLPENSVAEQIMAWTYENTYLMKLYDSNYILSLLNKI